MILEDFYEEVLKKLGVLAAEESPSASDQLEAQNKYQQMHELYSERDLVTWFEDDEVPDWIADGFASMVAFRLTGTFSVGPEKYITLERAAGQGETDLIAHGQRRQMPTLKKTFY